MAKTLSIKAPYPPGDFAIWIIVYVELVTFGLLFVGYAYSRRANLHLFNDSQLLLNQTTGFINTLLLITSSFFIVKAVEKIKSMTHDTRYKSNIAASHWLLSAIVLGSFFLVLKLTEFSHIFGQGITLSTNTFFMFYLLLTMFHFMHVSLGVIILVNLYRKTKSQGYTSEDCRGLESGALYWHLVDLLWIVLFPLVYIIR
ncbi:MAG: cytochrome c oxidase subunit 3 [Sulfuricurvum sp.]|uniref:cytochrome c oxidase subunit 3 n=1 Tax=Sulfuricurvum sp. TaxID=2025608 RepID=UPI00261CCC27|nr:cytochrome c oxidase subunit 3 [Sulfuricurvum sp.]MDD5160544.1 cytochrome c oxidase subunit 3 [Sulfuricurvum sp.]